MTADNFVNRLAQAKLPTEDDITDFVKEADFDSKLKDSKKKVTSNKTKSENELHELSKKVKLISTKELIEDSINKYKILNGAKYFSSSLLQNCLVFISVNKCI